MENQMPPNYGKLYSNYGKQFVQNISGRDGPAKSTETRQGWKYARRLSYYKTMKEKKDKKTTLLRYDGGKRKIRRLPYYSTMEEKKDKKTALRLLYIQEDYPTPATCIYPCTTGVG